MAIDYRKIGVPWLATLCYKLEGKEQILTIELEDLFTDKHIKQLVTDKMSTASKDMTMVDRYNEEEKIILQAIQQKVLDQTELLGRLQSLLKKAEALQGKKQAPTPTTTTSSAEEQEYQRLEIVAHEIYSEIEGGNDITNTNNFRIWFYSKHAGMFYDWRRDPRSDLWEIIILGEEEELKNGSRAVIIPPLGHSIGPYFTDTMLFYFDGYSEGMKLDSSDVRKFARVAWDEPNHQFKVLEKGVIRKGDHLDEVKGWINVSINKPVSFNLDVNRGIQDIVPKLALGRKIPELEAYTMAEFTSSKDEIEKEQLYTFEWSIKQRLKGKVVIHKGMATKDPNNPIPSNFRSGREAELMVELKRNRDSKLIAKHSIKVRLVKPDEIDAEKKLDLIANVEIIQPERRKDPALRLDRTILPQSNYNYLPPILHIGERIPALQAKANVKTFSEEMAKVADMIDAERGYKFEWFLEQVQRRGMKKVLRKVLIHRGSRTKASAASDNPIPEDVFKKEPAKLMVEVVRQSDSAVIGYAYMDVILQRSPRKIAKEEAKIIEEIPRMRFNLVLKKEDAGKLEKISRRASKELRLLAAAKSITPDLLEKSRQLGRGILGLAIWLKGSKVKKAAEAGEILEQKETERKAAMGEGPRLTLGGEPRGPVPPQDLDLRRSEEANRAKKELLDGLDKLSDEE